MLSEPIHGRRGSAHGWAPDRAAPWPLALLLACLLLLASTAYADHDATPVIWRTTAEQVGAEKLRQAYAEIESGREIYDGYCSKCHGTDGIGDVGGPNLRDGEWLRGDGGMDSLVAVITFGVHGKAMPSWRNRLNENEIRKVAAYLVEFRDSAQATSLPSPAPIEAATPGGQTGAATFDPASLQGRPGAITAGKRIFLIHCSHCHGGVAWGGEGGPNLTDDKWRHDGSTYENLVDFVTNGVGPMPYWSKKLNGTELKQVAAFVYYLRDCPTELWKPCLP